MFKKGLVASIAALMFGATLSTTVTAQEDNVLKVASHLPPMTDIVEIAAEVIAEPYTIELVEVSDNIQYNEALLNDEVYANFAQHEPFAEIFNQERDGDLVAIQPVYNAILGFYSPVYDSIEELEDGAEVAIPSDITNEARALLILESYDLIELDEEAGMFPTVDNITENPHNLEFLHIDLLNLTGAYEDGVELVFNYPTYITSVGLTPADAVLREDDEEFKFAIQVIIREGNLDTDATKALQAAFASPEVYDFLEELAENGHLEAAFELEETEDEE
ncbi:MetQ/NlpA family ABC transporter substrate-binding protein [Fundicoccus sp. Sow4_F4]|uniref:MetQ/NlpA family ABC transporter substrate-binding protein n=1 Tax=Fundicoccus sp. Sow4_F4 TaxID=3438783 RepID=UPI003F923485